MDRAEFEGKFPVPDGVVLHEIQGYVGDDSYDESAWISANLQQARWCAWQAAIHDPCEWLQDEWDNSYDTSCGNKYEIIDGTPEDNGMKFCTYCGGKLEAITTETQGKHE